MAGVARPGLGRDGDDPVDLALDLARLLPAPLGLAFFSGRNTTDFALLAAAWFGAAPAVAADDAAPSSTSQPAPGVPWAQLTSEQQTVLEPYRERWNQLPPERQQAFARGADRWSWDFRVIAADGRTVWGVGIDEDVARNPQLFELRNCGGVEPDFGRIR